LGRGAAQQFSIDLFDSLIFAQPYFDRAGMILAFDDNAPVGFVHVGFPPDEDFRNLSKSRGIICAIMVLPAYRRRGIGTALIEQAEKYLQQLGINEIQAGCSHTADPFYHGLYGGTRPSGFLKSNESAEPFCKKLGYEPSIEYMVMQRDLKKRDPISFRLVNLRRRMELVATTEPRHHQWWWHTRFGRLDSVRFLLKKKGDNPPVASISVLGLDHYISSWRERCIGLFDLYVEENERRSGFAQLLILEVIRRMKDEMVTMAEIHIPANQPAVLQLVKSCGFEHIDTGVVYRKILPVSGMENSSNLSTIEFTATEGI
jgi:GNAT superfamily N-acetyltransferase